MAEVVKPPVKIPPYRKAYNYETKRMVYSPDVKQFPLIYVSQISPCIVGWGAHLQAGGELKNMGVKHAMIVSTGLRGSGIVEEVESVIKQAGLACTVWTKAHSNPRDIDVPAGLKVYESEGCDGFVSVGGGSSHDTAKLIRVLHENKEKPLIREWACQLDPHFMTVIPTIKPVVIPQVAINTDTGTGADTTGFAVVTDTELKWKFPVVAINIMPSVGINDPSLLRCQPERIAAQCGIDCFLHGYGGFRNRIPHELSNAVGFWATKLAWDNLPEFVYNRWADKACEAMAWGQMLGAGTYAFGGGVGMVHAMAHQLSAIKDLHHGLTNAIMMVPVEREWNIPACADAFAYLLDHITSVDTTGMDKYAKSERWVDEMERFRNLVGITDIKLGNYGFTEADCEHMARYCYNDLCEEGNPRDIWESEAEDLYKGML